MNLFRNENSGFYAVEIGGLACGGCEVLQSEISEVLPSFPQYKFVRLDMEKDMAEIEALAVTKIPALILFYQGKEFARAYGYQPAEILELWIDAKTEERLKQQ
ncbi:MAG: thioredoxin family protein [Clostridia bacterium]|nr:thioredoxin family protein [Clostridia bacterium]